MKTVSCLNIYRCAPDHSNLIIPCRRGWPLPEPRKRPFGLVVASTRPYRCEVSTRVCDVGAHLRSQTCSGLRRSSTCPTCCDRPRPRSRPGEAAYGGPADKPKGEQQELDIVVTNLAFIPIWSMRKTSDFARVPSLHLPYLDRDANCKGDM
jgi:hypothetical protein